MRPGVGCEYVCVIHLCVCGCSHACAGVCYLKVNTFMNSGHSDLKFQYCFHCLSAELAIYHVNVKKTLDSAHRLWLCSVLARKANAHIHEHAHAHAHVHYRHMNQKSYARTHAQHTHLLSASPSSSPIDSPTNTQRPTLSDQPMTKEVGSPFYSAPEIDRKSYGWEVDIFAVGLTIYTLLAGFPEESSGIWRLIYRGRIADLPFPKPNEINQGRPSASSSPPSKACLQFLTSCLALGVCVRVLGECARFYAHGPV